MLQSFLIGRLPVAMTTVLKIRLPGLVCNVLIHHLSSLVNMRHLVFELRLLQFSANERPFIVTMATRSK